MEKQTKKSKSMETPWSELPVDILRFVFERLISYADFHRAKMVCANWYLCSKQTARPKMGSPLLMVSQDQQEHGFRLYSPNEDRVYETKGDYFSGYRFLANSGKWFLVVDSRTDLYIIDVFSEEKIRLPPIESIEDGRLKLKRSGDRVFSASIDDRPCGSQFVAEDLRGRLWVDDKSGDYVVVWKFEESPYLGFFKRGIRQYREINTWSGVGKELRGAKQMVLKGYSLYLLTDRKYIRRMDLSGPDGFKDVPVPKNHMYPLWTPESKAELEKKRTIRRIISFTTNIAVTTSGEVLFVECTCYESDSAARDIMFGVYKRDSRDLDPMTHVIRLVEVDSLGDEALFLDLGTTVPADPTLGIEPNSIYFTRGDRLRSLARFNVSGLHICVYNLATRKTIKDFPTLSSLKLKDAHWFLPY